MTDFSDTLRTWRKARRFSQLELALEADVSARHISFLESGRSAPSIDMVARLGDALQMPLSARNQMLAGAGFAHRYPARAWDDAALQPIRAAVSRMLTGHMPYPGISADGMWRIVELNPAAKVLFSQFGAGVGDSLLDLLLGDDVRAAVENWDEVANHTAQRLRTESAAMGGVKAFDEAAEKLSDAAPYYTPSEHSVIPTVFQLGDLRLSLFSTIAQFGTPEDVTLDAFKVELYFPSDEASERLLNQLAH